MVVEIVREPVDEIPAAPDGSHARREDVDAAAEERKGEVRSDARRGKSEREHDAREDEVRPLLVSQLAQPHRGVVNGSTDHLTGTLRPQLSARHPRTDGTPLWISRMPR